MRRVLVLAFATFVLSLSANVVAPSISRAQALASYGDGVALLATTVAVSSVVLSFAIADLVSYANDRPWNEGWSVVDVIVGVVGVLGGLAVSAAEWASGGVGALTAVGLVTTALGVHVTIHGLWSFDDAGSQPPPTSVAFVDPFTRS